MKKNVIPKQMFYRMLGPSLISALALSIADMADALVVGNRIGETGLAAIGIVTPLYMIFNLIGYGFSTGGSIIYAKLSTSGKYNAVQAHFRKLCLWLMGISVGIAVLGNLLFGQILYILGAGGGNSELISMCSLYARPLLAATPIFMLNFLLYDFVRSDNGAGLASLGFSLGCIVDLVLNILLVIVFNKGIQGSIVATIIAQAVSVLILTTHLFSKRGILKFNEICRVKNVQEDIPKLCRNSLRIGFSTSVQYILQFLFLTIGNHLLMLAGRRGRINGELYVAIFDLVLNVSFVAMAVYQAVADTMQPLASIFSAECDDDSLKYTRRLSLFCGITMGAAAALAIAVFAGSISKLFGITESVGLSIYAIRVFCLSTPFAGFVIIMTRYDQSCGNGFLAGVGTMMRTAVILLPLTLIMGLFAPKYFWWLFPITESMACLVLVVVRKYWIKNQAHKIPVFTVTLDNEHRNLEHALEGLVTFCEENKIEAKRAVQIQLAMEELCMVTIEKAFTGGKDEYIQLTLVAKMGEYILHIRNSAPFFNPLDMRMAKITQGMEEDIMDSIGVMMVRKTAKDLQYRNYVGCNVMTVTF